MNSTGCLVVPGLLCSTAALTLCSKASSSSALILDFSSSVRTRSRLPELAGVFLGNSQPVVGRATVFSHAAALKMGQTDKILRRKESLPQSLQFSCEFLKTSVRHAREL